MPDTKPDSRNDMPDPADRTETARYIGRQAAELRGLAIKAELPFLAYLLGMAEDDALSSGNS